jgi:hypothetical protein
VDHGAAERTLRGAVGQLDPFDRDEGPESGPDLEQIVGEPAVQAGALAVAAGVRGGEAGVGARADRGRRSGS